MTQLSVIEIGERVLKEEPLYPSEADNYRHHRLLAGEAENAELFFAVLTDPFYQLVLQRANWLNMPVTQLFTYMVFDVATGNLDYAMLMFSVSKVIAKRRSLTAMNATEFITYYNGNVLDPSVVDIFLADSEVVRVLNTPSAWSV